MMKPKTTPEARRLAIDQALANTRIEGHIPTPEFEADAEAFVGGKLNAEQMVARSLARARAMQPEADQAAPEVGGRVNFR